jgi:diaminopimelate decarboxylase
MGEPANDPVKRPDPPTTRGAGPWPASARFGPDGLELGGLPAAKLAHRFGTPLVVFDEREVRARMRAVRDLFPRAAYAVKAFTCRAVLRAAYEEGLHLLCASGGELEACLRAGVPAERIQLHGNAKTDDELQAAVRHGVGLVIVDGPDELERLNGFSIDAGRIQPILLRVIPEVDVVTHEAIATGHAASKFGTPLSAVGEVVGRVGKLPGIRVDGLHAHAGSQVLEVDPFVRVLAALVRAAAEAGLAPRVLDVGGGFGVAYADEPALDIGGLAEALGHTLQRAASQHGWPLPELQVEPGRFFVANAGVTLYRVLGRKEAGGRRLVAVDGGMSDNLRPMLYGAVHAVQPASAGPPGVPATMTIVGRHCESGDVLAPDVRLPSGLDRGDLLAFGATGAYTYSLASNYNRFGRPAVVGVADGRAVRWLRREDAADMDRLEVPPRPLDAGLRASLDGIEIRPARPADARSFLEFWRLILGEEERLARAEPVRDTARAYARRFRRSWSSEEAHIVAVSGDRVVGNVVVSRDPHPVTRHVASLGIAVAADHRGRGIGAALLAESFRWARSVGVRKLLLSVYPGNTAAIALYRKFGFVEEGRLSRQSRRPDGFEDEILMAAWLEPDAGAEDPDVDETGGPPIVSGPPP